LAKSLDGLLNLSLLLLQDERVKILRLLLRSHSLDAGQHVLKELLVGFRLLLVHRRLLRHFLLLLILLVLNSQAVKKAEGDVASRV